MDVVVVGAGFWGTAIALRLRSCGLEVALYDCAEPHGASRAAGGLAYPDRPPRNPPTWWGESHQRACGEWLLPFASVTGEWMNGRWRPGLWLVDCPRLLASGRPECRRTSGLGDTPWTVLATGVFTDRLLRDCGLPEVGVGSLPGRGLLFAGNQEVPLTHPYRLPGDTRTRKATVRPWGRGQVRVGDTLELARLDEQLAVLRSLGGEPTGEMFGLRPVLPQLLVEIWAPGVIVATGGHRSGLSTAGGVALRVQELVMHGGES